MTTILELFAILFLLGLGGFAVVSWREGERRACLWSAVFALAGAGLYLWAAQLHTSGGSILRWVLVLAPPLVSGILLWPVPSRRTVERGFPRQRVDERDTMFARDELVEGSARFRQYYRMHPELKAVDDAWRSRAGLLAPRTRFHHRFAFAAAAASFDTVEELHRLVEGSGVDEHAVSGLEDGSQESTVDETGARPSDPGAGDDSTELTRFLCGWAKKLGAVGCGVTPLREGHLYTVGGRRERWGRPIHLRHRWAVAFTVEMDGRMMRSAPDASTVMESAQQYLTAGAIAVQMAVALRKLGYRARAHIDANYEVICPLVARDAGLGEIGRMGLLMTPRLGPRVRIGVVTTDAPLVASPPREDPTVEAFCRICRKCAAVCPSQAISWEDPKEEDGVRRWRIDPVACFSYWGDAGTDCGRCVVTCPFSHPDHPYHNLIRWGIRRSPLFRRFALEMDDFFYGRKPRRRPLPSWLGRPDSDRRGSG